jgi:hypothetical protein
MTSSGGEPCELLTGAEPDHAAALAAVQCAAARNMMQNTTGARLFAQPLLNE